MSPHNVAAEGAALYFAWHCEGAQHRHAHGHGHMGMDWVLHMDTCNDREGNVMAMLIPTGLGFEGLGFRALC